MVTAASEFAYIIRLQLVPKWLGSDTIERNLLKPLTHGMGLVPTTSMRLLMPSSFRRQDATLLSTDGQVWEQGVMSCIYKASFPTNNETHAFLKVAGRGANR